MNGILLHPLPFPHSEQLIILHESKRNFEFGGISFPNFKDWRKDNHSFSSMSVSHGYYFSLTGKGEAEQIDGQYMTSGFFETLGVKSLLGRTFAQQEEISGAAPIALISEGLWKRKYDASPDVLSKTISLNGKLYSIIGVIPSSFHLATWSMANRDVYLPMGQWNAPGLMVREAGMGLRAIARLKPGVSIEQANADMARVSQNLAQAYSDIDTGIGARLVPLKEQLVGDIRPYLLLIMASVGLVLMIACVNIVSLLLARSTTRAQEFGIRAALGASRTRMIRQLLTESLLLSIASGALGLVIAVWGTHTCLKLLPQTLPRAEEIGLDLRVLFFTLVITLLTGTLFGLLPAFRTSQTDPHSALKAGGRGSSAVRHRAQSIFVVSEMAIALVLLIGAGLMIRSLQRLWKVDPGFNPQNVLTFGYTLPPSMIGGNPTAIRSAFHNFEDQIAPTGISAVLRYQGDLTGVFNAIRRTVDQNSHEQIFYDVHTMQSSLSSSLAQRRFVMILLGSFAALSLLLASIGIYGVIAYLVEQRSQEIGIRLALGAQRTHVLSLILWQGMRLALIGIAIGIAAGLVLTRMMTRMLYGISATDPGTFIGVAALLMLVVAAACYIPARRASHVDPMHALHSQ